MKLLVTMGLQPDKKEVWDFCTAGLVLIDWDQKSIIRELSYVSPPETAYIPGRMQFTQGCLNGDKLLVPTNSELVFVDLCSWKIEQVISLPHFNDIHHAAFLKNAIYVCNTGLDCVLKLSPDGTLLETYSITDKPTWDVFDINLDYRKINTKPHQVHPNHIFELNDELWVTRCIQKDAVPLEDRSRKLNVGIGEIHDGIPANDLVYFTVTSGVVVGVDPKTGQAARVVDLNQNDTRNSQLGWCRGFHLVDDHTAFVGFTSFRPTAWKNMAHWVLQDGQRRLQSRIGLYDLTKPCLLDEMTFSGKWGGASVYSIFILPD